MSTRLQSTRLQLTCLLVNSSTCQLLPLLHNDRFVFRHEQFHDTPAYKISHCTDAEDYHIAGRFTFKAHERERRTLRLSVGEELSRTFIDHKRTYSACHSTNTCDCSYR